MIIHIGGAKCASSYIQSSILKKVENYKYYGTSSDLTKRILHYCQGKKETLNIKNVDNEAIISHEGLSVLEDLNGTHTSKKISDILNNAKIIFVIREQRSWLASRYSQDLLDFMGRKTKYYEFKEWLRGSFHEELGRYGKVYDPLKRIRYDKIIESYENRFDEVCVLCMEDVVKNERILINYVEQVTSSRVEFEGKQRKNKRRGYYEEEIEKLLYPSWGNKRIARVLGKIVPYKKREVEIPKKVLKMIVTTNRRIKEMGISICSNYLV